MDWYQCPHILLRSHAGQEGVAQRHAILGGPDDLDQLMLGDGVSWLNLIEGFFSKFARSVLRHIRVTSKHELKPVSYTHLTLPTILRV